ncbi:MAG: hypothetical protein WDN45_17995 [Caulobacteraceae bacterium]
MIVELQRDADDVVARLLEQSRGHGGVDPTRHGGDHAGSLGQGHGVGGEARGVRGEGEFVEHQAANVATASQDCEISSNCWSDS